MDTCINTLLPLSIYTACITTYIGIVSFWVLHWFVATCALCTNTVSTVRKTIRYSLCAIIHEGVGWEYKFNLPISISTIEQKFFETAVLGNISFFNKNWSLILHISWWGTWVLIIMTIIFNCESRSWNNPVSTNWHFLWIVTWPNFDFVNVTSWKTSLTHSIIEVGCVLVAVVLAFK